MHRQLIEILKNATTVLYNYLKDNILKRIFKEYNRLLFFKSINQFFSQHIMMKNSRFVKDKKIEDNIIKYIRNIFRLKKGIENTKLKDVRNVSKLKKEIDDTIVKDIRNILD